MQHKRAVKTNHFSQMYKGHRQLYLYEFSMSQWYPLPPYGPTTSVGVYDENDGVCKRATC